MHYLMVCDALICVIFSIGLKHLFTLPHCHKSLKNEHQNAHTGYTLTFHSLTFQNFHFLQNLKCNVLSLCTTSTTTLTTWSWTSVEYHYKGKIHRNNEYNEPNHYMLKIYQTMNFGNVWMPGHYSGNRIVDFCKHDQHFTEHQGDLIVNPRNYNLIYEVIFSQHVMFYKI